MASLKRQVEGEVVTAATFIEAKLGKLKVNLQLLATLMVCLMSN